MPQEQPCPRHPNATTVLCCGSCGQPICPKCMVDTPAGYKCPDCARPNPTPLYNVSVGFYLIALPVAVFAGIIGGLVAHMLGFFVLLVAPGIGTVVGDVVNRAARRKRGVGLGVVAAAGVVFGGLLPGLMFGHVVFVLLDPFFGLYIVMAAGAAYWRLQ